MSKFTSQRRSILRCIAATMDRDETSNFDRRYALFHLDDSVFQMLKSYHGTFGQK